MKFRFTITRKLLLAFAILIIGLLFNTLMFEHTINRNREVYQRNQEIYTPSVAYLQDLYYVLSESKMLIKNWVYIDKKANTPDKRKLRNLHKNDYPELKAELDKLSGEWSPNSQKQYKELCYSIDSLFSEHQRVMNSLATFEDYDNPMVIFDICPLVDTDGAIIMQTNRILGKLAHLIEQHEQVVKSSNHEMMTLLNHLERLLLLLSGLMIAFMLVDAYVLVRAIVKPVARIKIMMRRIGKGDLPKNKLRVSNDELGDISAGLNSVIDFFRQTSEFARKIGRGYLETPFRPLSSRDILGNALLKMRDSLRDAELEEERHQQEEAKANWLSQGLARLGDITHESRSLEVLSQKVLRFLLEYVKAVQAGIYFVNNEDATDIHLELVASIAFDKAKNSRRRIELSDGFVGDCAINKQSKYITNLPKDYVRISSGAGEASPRVLLVVPLKVDDTVFAVMEFTALQEFEAHQIDFLDAIAERFAFTISFIRSNEQTMTLLDQSRMQANQLASQEEELRQNLEELQATQDEMEKKQEEIERVNRQLKRNEEELEQKVIERTAEVVQQKEVIEQKNKDITDSINYAKRIQESMLPRPEAIRQVLPESFILFKPLDIVSGDFFWFAQKNGKLVIAAVDCTGHGVPGAFMSMVGDSYLDQIVNYRSILAPDEILDELHKSIRLALRQSENTNQDGMDMALCVIDPVAKTLEFAGAKNPLVYIQDHELVKIKGDKHPIGGFQMVKDTCHTAHCIDISRPTTVYIFSDGFQDQFGGHDGRKFMTKNLYKLLHKIHQKPMDEQQQILDDTIVNWMGAEHRQIDDILMIGFRL